MTKQPPIITGARKVGRRSKLTDDQWSAIFVCRAQGEKVGAIALAYKVSSRAIYARFGGLRQVAECVAVAVAMANAEAALDRLPAEDRLKVLSLARRTLAREAGSTDALPTNSLTWLKDA
jgi:hypothetical protein